MKKKKLLFSIFLGPLSLGPSQIWGKRREHRGPRMHFFGYYKRSLMSEKWQAMQIYVCFKKFFWTRGMIRGSSLITFLVMANPETAEIFGWGQWLQKIFSYSNANIYADGFINIFDWELYQNANNSSRTSQMTKSLLQKFLKKFQLQEYKKYFCIFGKIFFRFR